MSVKLRERCMNMSRMIVRARTRLERLFGRSFPGSTRYWDRRYATGGNSGVGSRNQLAEFKAQFLNQFVVDHDIQSIIELGCGDGIQLLLANYPAYFGTDVSPVALDRCRKLFKGDGTKRFDRSPPAQELFDLALSLDVIYHLVEDEIFHGYMTNLFQVSRGWVIIYSSDISQEEYEKAYPGLSAPHVRHRRFSGWVNTYAASWRLVDHAPNAFPFKANDPNSSLSEFFIYARQTTEVA